MKHWRNSNTWQTIKPWAILATYIIVLFLFLLNFNGIKNSVFSFFSLFKALFYAIAIAYILNIPMSKIERLILKKCKATSFIAKHVRGISILLTLLLAIIVIVLMANIVFPQLANSLIQLFSNLGTFFKEIVSNIDAIFRYLNIDFKLENIDSITQFLNMDWNELFKQTVNFLGTSAGGIMDNVMSFTGAFAVGFTAFMFSFYLLGSKEKFIRQFREVFVAFCPRNVCEFLFDWGHRANSIFTSFVGGQLLEACILGTLYYITMRIFGFAYPELIAALIAICSIVPVLGPMFAMAVGAIMILSVDPLQSIWFIIYFQVLSQIEDNFIYPRVVGNSVGLPGLWVLLSIFVFGDLFGLVGMICAVPTTAFLYTLFAKIVHMLVRKKRANVSVEGVTYEE